MKNKILKFDEVISLLKESLFEEDEQDLNDVLLSLKDELIDFEVSKGYFSKSGIENNIFGDSGYSLLHKSPISDEDKYCFCVSVDVSKLDLLKLGKQERFLISDSKIFKIISELHQIAERYKNFYIFFNVNSFRPSILLFITIESDIDSDSLEFNKLYKTIQSRNSLGKASFNYNTTVKLEDDKIIVSTDSYEFTERKFKYLVRDLDLTNFKIETKEGKRPSGFKDIIKVISLK